MVPLTSLVVPILLSAVIVFVVSSILHMVLPFHRNDMKKVPAEDEFLETVRRLNIPPADYGAPHPGSMAGMKDPAYKERQRRGPIVVMTVAAGGSSGMGAALLLWFVYAVVVSIFAGYIAGRALDAGADYLQVFRFAGCTAFLGYSMALAQQSIWYKRSWATTLLAMFDGLIYGLLTGGTFGWLWPR